MFCTKFKLSADRIQSLIVITGLVWDLPYVTGINCLWKYTYINNPKVFFIPWYPNRVLY